MKSFTLIIQAASHFPGATVNSIVLFLLYFQITLVSAQSWGPPIELHTPAYSGISGSHSSAEIVNTKVGIAYYNESKKNLMFVRAVTNGSTRWLGHLVIDSTGDVGQFPSLSIVNGNPAIVYYDVTNGNLKYVRATNISGSAWGTPITVDATGLVGKYCSIQIVSGNPAISYYDETNGNLKYIRATDVDGTTWGTSVIVDASANDVGKYTSLKIVNGNPAIAYQDFTNRDLYFVRATSVDGTTWGTPLFLTGTTTIVGQSISMEIVGGGYIGIAYFDNTNGCLRFALSGDITGTSWVSFSNIDGSISAPRGIYNSLKIISGNPAISYYDIFNSRLKYIRATDIYGSTWSSAIVIDDPASTDVGMFSSMVVDAGNPGVAYYDNTNSTLKFIRATNATGTTWGTPEDFNDNHGSYTSSTLVNGNPAVAYYNASNTSLMYSRANDPQGTSWSEPILVEISGTNDYGTHASLKVVNGNPAIAYADATNGDLRYIRATDVNGTTWGSAVNVDNIGTGILGHYTSMEIVNGNPAITYYDVTNTNLRYVRATDASGTAWGTPVTAIDFTVGDAGLFTCLKVVNGNPAISYMDQTNTQLKYVRASNTTGSSWGASIILDGSLQDVGAYTSMEVVNGFPAITYYDFTNTRLMYKRATNANGSAWGAAVVIDGASNDVGLFTSLEIINSSPAVAYYDATNSALKYCIANDIDGTTWSTPVTLASTGITGKYASLNSLTGASAGIAFYDQTLQKPYYISSVCNLPTTPTISTSLSTTCSGSSTTLSISSGALNDAGDWKWYSSSCGGTLVGTGSSIFVSPSATSTYYARAEGGCVSPGSCSSGLTITVNSLPSVVANASDINLCSGENTTLTGSGANTYSWTGGITNGVPFAPTTTTTYTVTGTNTATGCSNTNDITITVNSLPTVTANATDANICTGESTTLTGAGASTYSWTGGVTDGVSFIPSSTNTYTVTGTNTATGCSNTAAITITVNSLPTVIANATDIILCNGESTTLTGSGANSYVWTGGVTNGVPFNPISSTTYTVTGTNTSTGCIDTDMISITVNPLPTVVANATDITLCSGESTTLTGSGTDSYSWTGGVLDGISLVPSSTTNYTVTGTNTVTGCSNTDVILITVNSLPSVTANATDPNLCSGESTILTGNGADTYSWTGGIIDGVSFIPTSNTTYTVIGTNTTTGCTNTDDISITITSITNGVSFTAGSLVANQTGASYKWLDCNTGNLPISGATSQSYTPTLSSSYAVEITLNGCTDTSSCITFNDVESITNENINISIYPNPNDGIFIIDGLNKNTTEILIYDVTGKLVYAQKNNASIIQLDLTYLESGIYLINIDNLNFKIIKK